MKQRKSYTVSSEEDLASSQIIDGYLDDIDQIRARYSEANLASSQIIDGYLDDVDQIRARHSEANLDLIILIIQHHLFNELI